MAARRIIPTLVLALLFAANARAAGVGLRWNACFSDGGATLKTFACNTNSGTRMLVATFQLPAALSGVSGVTSTVEFASQGTLPAWWDYTFPGGCRSTGLSTTSAAPPLSISCSDWSSGLASSAYTYTIGTLGPNTASLRTEDVVTAQNLANLNAGDEYVAVTMTINNQNTVGLGACGGCTLPLCIRVRNVQVFTGGVTPAITLTDGVDPIDSIHVIWQSSVAIPSPPNFCVGPVPVRNSTWGSVKALYR